MNPAVFEQLKDHYINLPHCLAIGLKSEASDGARQTLSVLWRPQFVGNHSSNVIHGGIVTTLVDLTGALATAYKLDEIESIATLDLRIDYLHPAEPQQIIYATSECYKLSGQVAFVRTTCYQDDFNNPVALGMATYMRTPLNSANKRVNL